MGAEHTQHGLLIMSLWHLLARHHVIPGLISAERRGFPSGTIMRLQGNPRYLWALKWYLQHLKRTMKLLCVVVVVVLLSVEFWCIFTPRPFLLKRCCHLRLSVCPFVHPSVRLYHLVRAITPERFKLPYRDIHWSVCMLFQQVYTCGYFNIFQTGDLNFLVNASCHTWLVLTGVVWNLTLIYYINPQNSNAC